ncbi:hypothetical protein [Trinickia sp.]|uniref:hypothetical protein n=1 Tax=Trinickia sp. TaxID=2571163 RepID=UPI003F7E1199
MKPLTKIGPPPPPAPTPAPDAFATAPSMRAISASSFNPSATIALLSMSFSLSPTTFVAWSIC